MEKLLFFGNYCKIFLDSIQFYHKTSKGGYV